MMLNFEPIWKCIQERLKDLTVWESKQVARVAAEETFAQAVAEARADEARRCAADICHWCNNQLIADPPKRWPNIDRWEHALRRDGKTVLCEAGPIHERLHRDGSSHAPEVVKSLDFDAGEVKCIDKGAG